MRFSCSRGGREGVWLISMKSRVRQSMKKKNMTNGGKGARCRETETHKASNVLISMAE